MSKKTKILPVKIDSTSKAYITYNPTNFDIIPVSTTDPKSEPDFGAPRKAEESPPPSNVAQNNKIRTIPIKNNVKNIDLKESPINFGSSESKAANIKSILINSTNFWSNLNPNVSASNIASCSKGTNFDPKIKSKSDETKCFETLKNLLRSKNQLSANFGSINDPLSESKVIDFSAKNITPKFEKVSDSNLAGLANMVNSMNGSNFSAERNILRPTSSKPNLNFASFNVKNVFKDPNFGLNPNDPISGSNSKDPSVLSNVNLIRVPNTQSQNLSDLRLPALLSKGPKCTKTSEQSILNPLKAMEMVLKQCDKTDNSGQSSFFKSIDSIVKKDLDDVQSDSGFKESATNECQPVTVKSEPLSPGILENGSFSDEITESYKDIRSGLSEGEQSSNSNYDFESVMVKCEPEDEDAFYQETSEALTPAQKIARKRAIMRQNETPEERAQRLIQVRDAARARRARESLEQREQRLRRDRDKKRLSRELCRSEEQSRDEQLARGRLEMRLRRQNCSYREKERERDRLRHRVRRADLAFRLKEKAQERDRKRLSRFLKKYAEHLAPFHVLCPTEDAMQGQPLN